MKGWYNLVRAAGDDDGHRLCGIKTGALTTVRRQPRRILVSQTEVQRQSVSDFKIVLTVEMPICPNTTPIGGWIPSYRAGRVTEHPVGKGVTSTGGRGRILCHHAGVAEAAVMVTGVGELYGAARNSCSEGQNLFALDPGQVVGQFIRGPVLPLRPSVIDLSGEDRPKIAREVKDREARERYVLKACQRGGVDASRQVHGGSLSLEVGCGPVLPLKVAKQELVDYF
jgi:hypothetical protein